MTERTTEALRKAMAAVAGTAPEAPDLPLVSSRPARRWTPAVITAAAFVLTLVVGGVGLLILGGGSTPRQDAAGTGETWVRVPDAGGSLGETDAVTVFGGPGDQQMLGLVVLGGNLIAVGSDTAGGDGDAAVWTSSDGTTWVRVPHDEAVFGGPGDQAMGGVAAGGQGAVAVGTDESGGDSDAAVWTSPDGITWTRVAHDEAVFGGDEYQGMWAVAAGGPGFVAAGTDASGGDGDAAVWTSPDGTTWTRVPHDEAVFGGSGGQWMFGVAAGDLGVIVVGSDDMGGYGDAAVWTSTDGLTWARVPNADGVFGGPGYEMMSGVAIGDFGLVAVGSAWFGPEWIRAAAWTSRDGETWTRAPDAPALVGNDAKSVSMRAVAVSGTGVVAVGIEFSQESDPAVWTSPDGLSWTRFADPAANLTRPGGQAMKAVVAMPEGLVAIGTDGIVGYTDVDAAVWVALQK